MGGSRSSSISSGDTGINIDREIHAAQESTEVRTLGFLLGHHLGSGGDPKVLVSARPDHDRRRVSNGREA